MKKFTELFRHLDQTSSTLEKIQVMKEYFSSTPSEDAAWALFFLSGKRLKRLISTKFLKLWCKEAANCPDWLYDECYANVGDTAETIALLVPKTREETVSLSLNEWMETRILPLKEWDIERQRMSVISWWQELDSTEKFLINKILTGGFRVGVSFLMTLRALQAAFQTSRIALNQKLMGDWVPSHAFFEHLKDSSSIDRSNNFTPYPFYLASPLELNLDELGTTNQWLAEWKWDGIRSQTIHRNNKTVIWSRGIDMISSQFPEIIDAMRDIQENVVIDGEILPFLDNAPLPFGVLQKRLGRKKTTSQIIEQNPVILMAYDLLEYNGEDLRELPLIERREFLEGLIDKLNHPLIKISPLINVNSWNELVLLKDNARELKTEGIMLKRKSSPYGAGRQRGNWWKVKIAPMTLDLVLMYAQPGSGRRASLYTDYTFGAWNGEEIVPIAKAYSGLSQDEIKELDNWIRRHTVEKFGPVRQLEIFHVFEIAFEGIQASNRHKSGVALRFPRILRWRKDKVAKEADQLETIKKALQ
ncbi:MAG: ATP-dependent DNA ligase [Chlamydia sp. 32-24]|nr:MAG: ATP-dependent DNA ligase [Chlamydia sp. 32-24]